LAYDLPEAMFAKLRMASAVCDCEVGAHARERQLVTVLSRTERTMPLYPRLEFIKRMSAQRRAADMEKVA
jgi:hypothetical protein